MKFQFLNFNRRKGQSAIEFVILVMAVLFLFVGFLYFIQAKIADSQYQSLSVQVKKIALIVQDEINLAHSSANGYFRNFKLPNYLNGQEYQADLTDGFVFVRTNDGRHSIALPVANVSGNLFIGNNQIYRTNDSVFLN